jgi:hypothetical protein
LWFLFASVELKSMKKERRKKREGVAEVEITHYHLKAV